MNRAGKFAIGCLLAPVGLLVVGVMFWTGLRMAGVPDPSVTSKTFEQPLPTSTVSTPAGEAQSAQLESQRQSAVVPSSSNDAVRVVIDLEEGEFSIEPGPPDDGIRVQADYDEATYDLEQKYSVDDDGRPTYLLRLRSRVSMLRRLAHDGSFDSRDMDNSISVQLPVDTPMELVLSLSKLDPEAKIDLTGLALASLAVKLHMGDADLTIDDTNPLQMQSAAFQLGMGEFRVSGLSRLRASTIVAEGTMGEFTLDFDDALQRDTHLQVHGKMGNLTLRLPDNAVWDPEGGLKSTWAEVSGDVQNPRATDPETSPVLTMNGGIFMGQLTVDAVRVDASRSLQSPRREDR